MPRAVLKSRFTDDQRSNITNRRRAVGVHYTNGRYGLYTVTVLEMRRLNLTALCSRNLKILQTSPTPKIQEAKLVERPSDLRRGL